jgi:hypothetical protein
MGCLFGDLFVVFFGDLFVVLFGDLFVVLYTIYIMTFAPLIGVLMTSLNDVFWRLLSSSINVEFNDVSWRHLTASNTQFIIMAWQHWWSSVTHSFILIYSLSCSMRFVVCLRHVGRLYTYTINYLEARGPIATKMFDYSVL